jgi:hypothetical protein
VIADVRRPILGADFLCRHNLLVDLCGQRLIDAKTFKAYACKAVTEDARVSPVFSESVNKFTGLLCSEFP